MHGTVLDEFSYVCQSSMASVPDERYMFKFRLGQCKIKKLFEVRRDEPEIATEKTLIPVSRIHNGVNMSIRGEVCCQENTEIFM